MRLSAFSVAEENSTDPLRDRLTEVTELAVEADRIGLDAFWVAEHHFQPGGLCPSPPVLLAAVAARTNRIRIGSLVSVLPFHEPVETAETYALLDRISGGRLNFGVGSGYIPVELEGFGVDDRSKRERFDRALDTIVQAWEGREVRTERPGAGPVHLNIRPKALPHPPIWLAVQRREAIPHVGRRGLSLALIPYATVTDLAELRAEVAEFRSALPNGSRAEVAAAFHVFVGPTAERGVNALQRYLDSRRATGSAHFQAKVERDARHADARTILEAGLAFVGRPSELPAWLESIRKVGVDELLGIFDFGGLPLDASVRSMGAAHAAASRPG